MAEYSDTDSGTKKGEQRLGFKAMLGAAQRREVDAIAVMALDRFSRQGIGPTFD